MLEFLKIFALIVGMIPDLLKLMGTFQASLGTGTGAQKLELVKGVVQASYDVAQPASVAFETLWPKIATLIATIKTVFGADKLTG